MKSDAIYYVTIFVFGWMHWKTHKMSILIYYSFPDSATEVVLKSGYFFDN